jgi:formylglycine-generating enzyme required for sulfatase activity
MNKTNLTPVLRLSAGAAFCAAIAAVALTVTSTVALSQPRSFRDCDACPEMTALPAGTLAMGSPEVRTAGLSEEALKYAGEFEEQPQHAVSIRAFAIGTYEVTQAEWAAIMGENPSSTRGDRLPVENVSWEEAQEFARRLSERTGKPYRLPTEAEWEYAARAGSARTFPFGDDPGSLPQHAWFRGNADGHSHPVGSREPNAFGLHDMLGNVWEKTEDCWRPHYEEAPADGSARTDGDCDLRVVRGGSWVNLPQFLRSAARFRYSATSRYEFVGLRIARDLKD